MNETNRTVPAQEWPLRPWVLAAGLGLAGLLVYFIGRDAEHVPWRMALTALVFFGSLSAAFAFEPDRRTSALAFAAIVGATMAGIAWRVAAAGDNRPDAPFWLAAGVVALALALPLFQAGFHRLRWRTSYEETHYHVWADVLSAGGALLFTGLTFALLLVLSELFHLLRIDLLRDALRHGWFGWLVAGTAFGAALGVLRNQLGVVGTLQRVVLLVLALLAVPLAAALLLFLLAVLFSGIDVLWEATRSATPLLLACAAGSFVLVNAVVRDEDAGASGSRVMRGAALVLALGILPLAVLAALSMGTRIAQYGLSPERIWGLVAIVVAVGYGIAYFAAPVRGRLAGWASQIRRANLHLAVLTCAIALLLALPVFDFGAISARNQVARLEAGRIAPDAFDFAALRWEFGEAGREALARLAKGKGAIAQRAATTLAQKTRPYGGPMPSRTDSDFDLRVQPDDPVLRRKVLDLLKAQPYRCHDFCVAIDLGTKDGSREIALVQGGSFQRVILDESDVQVEPAAPAPPPLRPDSTVEVRTIPKRYIVVDGKPLDRPLD